MPEHVLNHIRGLFTEEELFTLECDSYYIITSYTRPHTHTQPPLKMDGISHQEVMNDPALQLMIKY